MELKVSKKQFNFAILFIITIISFAMFATFMFSSQFSCNADKNILYADTEITHTVTRLDHDGWFELLDDEIENLSYSIISEDDKTAAVYDGCDAEGDIIIPHKINYNSEIYDVTMIDDDAFNPNSEMTSILLPNSIVSIGYTAFASCSGLAVIVIPESVEYLGSCAFGCNPDLEVVINNNIPFSADGAFSNGNIAGTYVKKIIVPVGSKSDYDSAWSQYASIIEEEQQANTGVIADLLVPSVIIIALLSLVVCVGFTRKKRNII